MTVEMVNVQSALVFRDSEYKHRWYDAIGPGVVKYLQEFVHWPVDDTTHDPSPEWTMAITEAGGTTLTNLTDLEGGALLITCAGNEDDGIQMQLGHASTGVGENIALLPGQACYFGIEFALNDVTDTDSLFGVCVTDTDCLGAVTDGMYFRNIDASAVLNFVTEKDSVESETAVATMVDATYITAEFLFDGETVRAYINGGEITSTANSATSFPDNELLRLTLEFLSGEAVANTCTIKWLRLIHLTQ
jgi:hypothetical protein